VLYVTGRARDGIVVRVRAFAPHVGERAIDDFPGVRAGCAAAVGAVEDDGERMLLFVESRAPHPELAARCRSVVRATTGLEPHLVFVLPPGTLPRTAAGHVRRAETLRRWRAGTLVPGSASARARAVAATGR
jgi:acyl-CoA synthetase (AMP-forming)/AMP-acid ligase II